MKNQAATATEIYLKGLGISERPLILVSLKTGETEEKRVYRKTITK